MQGCARPWALASSASLEASARDISEPLESVLALGVPDGFAQFPGAADKALLGTQIDAHEHGIDAECPRAAAGVGIEAPDYGLVVLVDGRVGVAPAP